MFGGWALRELTAFLTTSHLVTESAKGREWVCEKGMGHAKERMGRGKEREGGVSGTLPKMKI